MNSILVVDKKMKANNATEQELELQLSSERETLVSWTILIGSVTAFAICTNVAFS